MQALEHFDYVPVPFIDTHPQLTLHTRGFNAQSHEIIEVVTEL